MSSPLAKMATTANFKELEKYVKHLFFKTSQIIVQSRQGGKSFTESQPNPKSQSWFSIAINDTSEISHESKKVVSGAQVSGQGILAMPLCIEISLKTTEGDLLVLETWVLSMKDSSDPTVRANTVYNRMGLLLKSILCVSRVLPAYKFARRQGPDTHVMCYRIFAGEPNNNPLGSGQQTAQIGQVITGCGTLHVRVEYRTQMTIIPGCVVPGSGSDPSAFSGSGSSQQSGNIWAKSDHFIGGENYDTTRRAINNPDYYYAGDTNVTTSDESSEAMKIFATSPPDTNFQYPGKRGSDHYSSNESLGFNVVQPPKFRSRSNTNQSHKSEDVSLETPASNEVKIGAFATKKSDNNAGDNADGTDDDFMDLFTLETSTPESSASEAGAKIITEKMSKVELVQQVKLENSPAKRAILFEEQQQPDTNLQTDKSKMQIAAKVAGGGDFVILNTPFSMAKPVSEDPKGDLGVFFKDVQAAPQLMTNHAGTMQECNDLTEASLESQFASLNDQLLSFENKSAEYDDLLKILEATVNNSESESEAN